MKEAIDSQVTINKIYPKYLKEISLKIERQTYESFFLQEQKENSENPEEKESEGIKLFLIYTKDNSDHQRVSKVL